MISAPQQFIKKSSFLCSLLSRGIFAKSTLSLFNVIILLRMLKKTIMSRSFAGMRLQEFCGVQLDLDALAGLASVCLLSHWIKLFVRFPDRGVGVGWGAYIFYNHLSFLECSGISLRNVSQGWTNGASASASSASTGFCFERACESHSKCTLWTCRLRQVRALPLVHTARIHISSLPIFHSIPSH